MIPMECSFCGKTSRDVSCLFVGKNFATICCDCVFEVSKGDLDAMKSALSSFVIALSSVPHAPTQAADEESRDAALPSVSAPSNGQD